MNAHAERLERMGVLTRVCRHSDEYGLRACPSRCAAHMKKAVWLFSPLWYRNPFFTTDTAAALRDEMVML